MSIRKVYTLFDNCLQTASLPVPTDEKNLNVLIQDMLDTMYANDGMGIAANQMGILKRVVVIDPSTGDNPQPILKIINPEITWFSNEKTLWEEGCLSVPGYAGKVERASRIKLRYEDENRTLHEKEFEGRLADCIQHEVDHLDGIVFIDHLSPLKRKMALKKIKKYIETNS